MEKVTPGQKRHTPITFGNGSSPNKRNKEDGKSTKRELYTPPSGKYSSNISSNYGEFFQSKILNSYFYEVCPESIGPTFISPRWRYS